MYCPPHRAAKRHKWEIKKRRPKKKGKDKANMTGRSTARSGRFHFSPPSSYLSIPSVPSPLNYFSCLIGLSVEDVPSDCHSEIAMFSKCLSGLAWACWDPDCFYWLNPPKKCSAHACTLNPCFPTCENLRGMSSSSTWHTTKASHCEGHTILWCQGSFTSSPGGWTSELVVSWEYQRAVPLWAWGEYMQNKQHSLN